MGKDSLSKIRANDTYRFMVRVLGEFSIGRHEVVDERPHPKIRFFYAGEVREFHFAGTPSSFRTPRVTEAKLRRLLRALDSGAGCDIPREADDGLDDFAEASEPRRFEAERNPIVTLQDGEALADSRDVAAFFSKNHKDVLRAIRDLHCSADFRERNFAPFKIKDLAGESTSHVLMTKDGFVFMAMGFTGEKAGAFKERYIAQFNAMESELRRLPANNVHFMVPKTMSEALRLAADLSDKVEAQKVEIEAARPKVEFHDAVAEAVNGQTVEEVAKVLGTGQNRLFDWLRRTGMIREKPSTLPYQRHIDEGHFRVIERQYKDNRGESHTYTRTLVTGKGLAYIQKRFSDEGEAA